MREIDREDARAGDDAEFVIERWRLQEISVCLWGQNPNAHVRVLGDDVSAEELVPQLDAAESAARLAVRQQLQLDRWNSWARSVGPKLALELGLDVHRISDLLESEVAKEIDNIERDLAVPALSVGMAA